MQTISTTRKWKRYLDESQGPRVQRFLESRGDSVFQQLSEQVNRAVRNNQDKITVIIHPQMVNAIEIHKSEYMDLYNMALNWFLKKENYERCSYLKKYISFYKSKNKKREKKTSKEVKV